MAGSNRTALGWRQLAQRRLNSLLKLVSSHPTLKRKAGIGKGGRIEIDFVLVGTARMQTLNKEYRSKNQPTDVLSFPAPPAIRITGLLGDLAICLPMIKSQAREMGHSPEVELQVLLTHGVLHLLGFDHEIGPKEAASMARWERRLLKECGVEFPGLIRRYP